MSKKPFWDLWRCGDLYRLMPEEQRLREAWASGDRSPALLEKLLQLALEKGRADAAQKRLLELARAGPLRCGRWWREALRVARALQGREQRGRKNGKTGAGGRLKLAFLITHPNFQTACMPLIRLARQRHEVLVTRHAEAVVAFGPHTLLSPQCHPSDILRLRARLPGCFFLYLRHGLVQKTNAVPAADYFDAVCAPGPEIAADFCRLGAFTPGQVWDSGYLQSDPLMRRPGSPIKGQVLFAPTHNRLLSAAHWLRPEDMDRCLSANPDVTLVIKLHPNTRRGAPRIWALWRAYAQARRRVRFVDGVSEDIAEIMRRSAAIVSDHSSTAFLFLALDRPIVLLTPPRTPDDINYDPTGIERRWRDVGVEILSREGFAKGVRTALRDPREIRARRRAYRLRLYGDTLDGRVAERTLERLEQRYFAD